MTVISKQPAQLVIPAIARDPKGTESPLNLHLSFQIITLAMTPRYEQIYQILLLNANCLLELGVAFCVCNG